MMTMNKFELKKFEITQEIIKLKIEIDNAEKWVERAKCSLNEIQEYLYDLEDQVKVG